MKVREISLVAAGAIVTAAVIALVLLLGSPPKVQAQTAASGGGIVMAVANEIAQVAPNTSAGTQGIITVNDAINRKVTAVSYYYYSSQAPANTTLVLSPPVSYTY